MATTLIKLCPLLTSDYNDKNPRMSKKMMGFVGNRRCSSSCSPWSTPPMYFRVFATKKSSLDDISDGSSFQEDLNFLLKLGAGSVAGAAVIKYGSALFPEITKPNIILALLLISTPVLVVVLLLIKQSKLE